MSSLIARTMCYIYTLLLAFPSCCIAIWLHLSGKAPALDEPHCLPSLHLHEDYWACALSNWCCKIHGLQPSVVAQLCPANLPYFSDQLSSTLYRSYVRPYVLNSDFLLQHFLSWDPTGNHTLYVKEKIQAVGNLVSLLSPNVKICLHPHPSSYFPTLKFHFHLCSLRDLTLSGFTLFNQWYPLLFFGQLALHLFFCLFIYLFFYLWLSLGLRCCTRAFSICGERELLFIAMCGLLIAVASLVAEHGL